MVKLIVSAAIIVLLGFTGSVQGQEERAVGHTAKIFLREGWHIQSSALFNEKGDVISRPEFQSQNWYAATVPSTVMGTLVDNKVYPDPFFDQNLRQIPGCSYPIGANFSNLPMPEDSPFRSSWWFRTEFHLPAGDAGKNIWLHFDGINFRANIWLNGQQIAGAEEIAGTFRVHELNIKQAAHAGASNTLAVEVFPQQPDDLGWTFVDWNPMPPDKAMGIFRDVYLTTSGPVRLRYPQVITHFDLPSLDTAQLTVNAELTNSSDDAVEGALSARLDGLQLSQKVRLEPHETKAVSFTPDTYPRLKLSHPRVWWPVHMGAQNLYELEMEFAAAGRVSDRQRTRFGIREITSEVDAQNHRVFKVNGRNILIRGGGWASDMFLRFTPERIRSEFQYVRDMNLNAIRLEGQLQPDRFFDLADEYGILIMAGWCCCSHWEHWQHRADYQQGPTWTQKDYDIAAKSQADQIRRLRNHPSVLVWLNGSDNPPPPDVERMYIDILVKYHWPNPYLSSATAKTTTVSGASGVKMEGPYDWVPASYWQLDKKSGGAHGFATEISPGPAVPPIESLRQMLPKDHLWPIGEHWNYHAGGGQFKTLKTFTTALEARYGPARDVEDYAMKSQLMTYEGQRAMFEAYGAHRYTATGVIQWMLNNAWPSMIWHLYDYYLMPGGGYFGTKKACEPIHVQYSYADKSIVVVNATNRELRNVRLTTEVYDIDLNKKFSRMNNLDVPADGNVTALVVPAIPDLSAAYFLKLTLTVDRQTVSENFYWLSTRDDVLDWNKSTWWYTPTTSYADMTQLQKLPPAKLSASISSLRRSGVAENARVTVTNAGRTLAFFVRLHLKQGHNDEEILPVIWQDNYFSLLPGETREVAVAYRVKDLSAGRASLVVEGWNSPAVAIPIIRAH